MYASELLRTVFASLSDIANTSRHLLAAHEAIPDLLKFVQLQPTQMSGPLRRMQPG